MDARAARRAAEKAARDLITARAAYIGELSDAANARTAARDHVDTAKAQAQQLLDDARAAGTALIDAAHAGVTDADTSYADRYDAAEQAGWTRTELDTLGYPAPTTPAAPRRRKTTAKTPAGTAASTASGAPTTGTATVDDGAESPA